MTHVTTLSSAAAPRKLSIIFLSVTKTWRAGQRVEREMQPEIGLDFSQGGALPFT
ncbi:hypothetical protein [Paraburkholderia bryophila]|uniref:Uncharacterized protein n=1 Tax=Paraburkholderia bryophila TaxID=420952 RepID=A0A329BSZ9_9BURK|nr:hypothetical protein [Paraburkholderia bryophila]RAS22095.1 hypothetical protein BX591_12537 [Paraburkholderia bryophila]